MSSFDTYICMATKLSVNQLANLINQFMLLNTLEMYELMSYVVIIDNLQYVFRGNL